MPEPTTAKFKVSCPSCKKQYVVPASAAGKVLRCQECQKQFRLPALQKNMAPASASTAPPAIASKIGNCVICQTAIAEGEPSRKCSGCSAVFHTDCWEYNKGCGVYGCSEAPPTEGLNSLEIPASHWGQEHKACPNCSQTILAAAVRCKHCGVVFETANPQEQVAFLQHEANRAKLPLVKAFAVALLIFSLIPCTAPFAAIGGSIWYALNRKTIAMLPGFHSALCKIAVGVSIIITLLLIAFTVANVLSKG